MNAATIGAIGFAAVGAYMTVSGVEDVFWPYVASVICFLNM